MTVSVRSIQRKPLGVQVRKVLRMPQFWFGLAIMVPWFAWYVIFAFRPVFLGLQMSMQKYMVMNPSASEFVGFFNFRSVLAYERFWIALRNTATYSVMNYVLAVPLALLISWCIVTVKRGKRFYEFVVFLPVVVSFVAIAMLFRMLMDPQFGAFNTILRSLGLPTSQFLASSQTALRCIVAVDVWKGVGFSVVLLSAAMLNVPEEMYDAARVDGVNGWQMFFKVTLPLIANTLLMISVLSLIGSLQVYLSPQLLGPGPGTSTLVVNQIIIGEAFSAWRFGFSTATAVLMFAVILILTVIQMRVLRTTWSY